jgi:hypothetical protein
LLQLIPNLDEFLKILQGHPAQDTPCGACIAEGCEDADDSDSIIVEAASDGRITGTISLAPRAGIDVCVRASAEAPFPAEPDRRDRPGPDVRDGL